MISYKGKLGAFVAIPVLASIFASIDLAALFAEWNALLTLSVNYVPPSVFGILQFIGSLQAALSAGFQPPLIDIKADLLVKAGLLKLKYDLLVEVSKLAVGGSFRVYEYEGQAGAFGAELGATLAGPDVDGGVLATQNTFAVVLLAEGGSAGATTLKILRNGVPS